MSDLQLGLLVIGAVIVVAVLAYNKWQEVRYRRQAERSFGPSHEDVLFAPAAAPAGGAATPPERREPTLGTGTQDTSGLTAGLGGGGAPASGSAAEEGQGDGEAEPPPAAEPPLSERIDYIVEFSSPRPVETSAAIEAATSLMRNFSKAVHLEAYDAEQSAWIPLEHGQAHARLRAGLQLADRQGIVTAQDLERFGDAVRQLAERLDATAGADYAPAAMQQAQALDRLCGEVDVQIALNIIAAGKPFSGQQVAELARSVGLVLEGDGRFRLRDQQGQELYALVNAGGAGFAPGQLSNMSTEAITFEFDVPRSPGGLQGFQQLAVVARQFATALGGRLVDDNRAALSDAGLAAIAGQLQPVYAALEGQGLPPGGPVALRLFS
jgi:hypothetical protein